jgi:LPXTG-motif cell wall-anchored protein
VEAEYGGISLQSEFGIVEAGQSALTLEPIVVYEVTKDTSVLVIDELHMFVQISGEDKYEILALYTFRNPGESVIAVEMTAQQQEIPFIKFPKGSEGLGYEAVQDSAPFTSMNEGFAMAPNEQAYGILAFSSVVKGEKETTVTQELIMPATAVRIFVPDGMEAEGANITADSPQDLQGVVYQSYVANGLKAGDALTFTVSGTPKAVEATDADATGSSNNTLLIAAGGLGIGLILVGAWMYYRDRKRTQADDEEDDDENEEEDEFGSSEEVMDAILALDDLHRAKKIAEDAYQKRRAELKEILKGMM